ncbi:hypothetical protein [Streptomyces sp. 1222.5]|uniref:hypothetical protein n=1 Tax=Streptomyces sp. 1222.5 TaxID=1881026 RepID=UPI003EBA3076
MRDLLPVSRWLAGRGGRPEGYCHRQMIDAIRYLVDNGIQCGRCRPTSHPGRGCTPSSPADDSRPSCTTGYARPSAGPTTVTRSRARRSSTRSR